MTKPDKGPGVVVMEKSHYNTSLKEVSFGNKEKYRSVSQEQPKSRVRPTKHFHPLLQKEKRYELTVRNILPKDIADDICPKGSRLAHLHGLPKTHKSKLAMRPMLSTIETYNYKHAKWLDRKLKPLSVNKLLSLIH